MSSRHLLKVSKRIILFLSTFAFFVIFSYFTNRLLIQKDPSHLFEGPVSKIIEENGNYLQGLFN